MERKPQSLSPKERLIGLVKLGVRDAKNQPDAPAMTLIPSIHGDLLGVAFAEMGREFSEDIGIQQEVIGNYVSYDLNRGGETDFTIRTKVFEDKRTKEQGIYIFLAKSKGGC